MAGRAARVIDASRLLPRELHRTNRPSTTAQLVCVWRALELDRDPRDRIVTDEYAPAFLDTAGRTTLRAARMGRPMLQRAERLEVSGVATHVLCRHAFIDEHLLSALDDGVEQVIVLGAGYDSRAYRLSAELGDRPVFEVDLPPLSRAKAALVARRPDLFGHATVQRVEIDFRTQTLPDRLQDKGFIAGRPTFVVWEGVAPYLTPEAVDGTLAALRECCGTGSTIALDLWDGAGGTGKLAPLRRFAAYSLAWIGEPIAFGLLPSEAPGFLADRGWDVSDLATAADLTLRYATDGRRSDPSLYAVAATLSRVTTSPSE